MASTTTTCKFNVHAPKDSKEMMRLRDFRLLQREASTWLTQALAGDQSNKDLSEDRGEYLVEDTVDHQERVALVHFDPTSRELTSLFTAKSDGSMFRVTQTPERQVIERSYPGSNQTLVYDRASGEVSETSVTDDQQRGSRGPVRLVDAAMTINVHDPKTPAEMFLLRDFRKEQKTVNDWLATALNPSNLPDNLSETPGEYMAIAKLPSGYSEQVVLVQYDSTKQDQLTTFRRSTPKEMHVCQPDPANPKKTLFEATHTDWGISQRKMSYDSESGILNYQANDNWLRLAQSGSL